MSRRRNGIGRKDRDRDQSPQVVNPPHKMRILQRCQGKVIVEIDEKQFEMMLNCMQTILSDFRPQSVTLPSFQDEQNNDSNTSNQISEVRSRIGTAYGDVRDTQDFRRRIPHFFMGRFKKWSKMHHETDVHQFLQHLQSQKKSKQCRFELGDFHKTFIVDTTDSFNVQQIKTKLKNQFIDFLQNEAVLQIIQYNKITTMEQKVSVQHISKMKYIDVIPDMVHELFQEKPFESFLAQDNIQKSLDKNRAYENGQSNYVSSNIDSQKSPFL